MSKNTNLGLDSWKIYNLKKKEKNNPKAESRPWANESRKIKSQVGNMEKVQGNDKLRLKNLLDEVDPPFTDEIMQERIPPKLKLPSMKAYGSSKDPVEHLETFQMSIKLHRVRDAIMCWSFSHVQPKNDSDD